jgi:CDP-4-dehydro-6-deoxyglucose reductase
VLGTRPVTSVVQELILAPDPAPVPFRAGQYVLLGDRDLRVPPRSYSVANAPRPDGQVRLLVTRVADGPTSGWVHDRLRGGDRVTLTGPFGTFLPDPDRSGPVLLLAAGSGMAPARALAEDLLTSEPGRPVTLVFSARAAADTIDDDRFRGRAATHRDFRYLLTLTRDRSAPPGPHVPELLARTFDTLAGWEVFASGPPGFVTACAAAALDLGTDPAAVHTEEFFADPQPWLGAPPGAAVVDEAVRADSAVRSRAGAAGG